jgi:sugar lactone lactonase YvrE
MKSSLQLALQITWMCAGVAHAQNIFTIAGIPYGHRDSVDSKPALSVPLSNVHGLVIDKITGRLLFSDQSLISRLEPDGSLLALVGRGLLLQDGETADGTLASFLSTQGLTEIAQDGAGALYVSDIFAGRVYRIALDGTVTTFAGGGTLAAGFASDGGPATAARLNSPRGLAFDSKGNLNIAELFCRCIRRVSPGGIISTVYTIPAPSSGFIDIEGLTIDPQDNLYFTEWMGNVVVKVTPGGTATTIAGTGVAGFSGDGGPAIAAQLNGPSGVTLDPSGNLHIADSMNHRVRKIVADGTISTIAGTGVGGFSGDGGPALTAQLNLPAETLFDNAGNMYITDYGNRRVRRVTPGGTIGTIAGNGQMDLNFYSELSTPSSGDGGPAIHATFSYVGGIAADASGNLYVSDLTADRVRKIAPGGTINTFAGNGQRGYSGDGGPASQAMLSGPRQLAVDPLGNLYVLTSDSRIRKITPDGIISLVAGDGNDTGTIRSQGDGGLAVNATLNGPGGVAFDAQGNIYIADTVNARLRKVDRNGIITTVVGPGQVNVDYYNAVANDPQGNIFLASGHALPSAGIVSVNRVNPDGSLTPAVGNGQPCSSPPDDGFTSGGVPALQALLCAGATELAIDRKGIMYLNDGPNLLRVGSDRTIQIVAGRAPTAIGDGGSALDANLGGPGTPTFDPAGNMYFPALGLSRIRKVTTTPYKLTLSPDHIGLVGPQAQTWSIVTTANFAEPLPYAVHLHTTDGGSWLSASRVTGLIGEPITVTINPAGLPSGFYQATVSVLRGSMTQVDVPVELLVP